jgi:hypothetical protein
LKSENQKANWHSDAGGGGGHDFFRWYHACSPRARPAFGSITQLGTIRLGKRTEKRVPRIKDFIELADLNDLVFGAWIFFLIMLMKLP